MPTCPFCSKAVPDNSSVCPQCLRAQPVTIPTSGRTRGATTAARAPARLIVLGVAMLGLGAYAFRQRDAIRESLPARGDEPSSVHSAPAVADPATVAPQVAPTIAPPVEIRIADSSSAKVAPNSYLAFPFSGGDRSTCRLRGTVRSLSGGPVDVFVVDGMGADDLANGRTPLKYYATSGSTEVTLDAGLDGRSHYSLIVANLGPRAKLKTIRLQARATCAD